MLSITKYLSKFLLLTCLLFLNHCTPKNIAHPSIYSNDKRSKDCPVDRVDWMTVSATYDQRQVSSLAGALGAAAIVDANQLKNLGSGKLDFNFGDSLNKIISSHNNNSVEVSKDFFETYQNNRARICAVYSLMTDERFKSDSSLIKKAQDAYFRFAEDFKNIETKTTQREIFDKNNKAISSLSTTILPDDDNVEMIIGTNHVNMTMAELESEEGYKWPIFECYDSPDVDITYKVKNKTLLISLPLTDLEGNPVGDIIDNRAILYSKNILDYKDNRVGNGIATKLEVYDNKKRIIFSMEILAMNKINIQGYFASKQCVVIMNPRSQYWTRNYMDVIEREIAKIQSIFPKPTAKNLY